MAWVICSARSQHTAWRTFAAMAFSSLRLHDVGALGSPIILWRKLAIWARVTARSGPKIGPCGVLIPDVMPLATSQFTASAK